MNILNQVVKGASNQFGREFGRAGANAILKGKNYYTVNQSTDYSERIKPSDSQVVRSIKEILKIKFVTTNKANISRLIELTDIAIGALTFNGVNTLNEIQDIKNLIEHYNDKFEHGSVLVDDDFKDKSVEFLTTKRNEFIESLERFNSEIKSFVTTNLELASKKRKSKAVASFLSFPLLPLGYLGFHKFYLGQIGYGFLYIILTFIFISPVLALINFIQLIAMSQATFDAKYNPEYAYYSQFKIEEQ